MARSSTSLISIIILTLVFVTLQPSPSDCCVGRKLVFGSVEAERPGMVSRILTILIHERTGTTVEVKFYPDRDKLLAAVQKGKVDLYVDHVDDAIDRLKLEISSEEDSERFKAVKRRFEEEENLIWLKPMGYSGIALDGRSLGPASAVVHKDTLKKFPALPRLLEKVGTRVVLDDGRLESLVSEAQSEKPAKVARNYLKEVKLI